MGETFLNISNHSSQNWDKNQRAAAEKYGQIVDLPFPLVSAEAGEQEIREIASTILEKAMALHPAAVMCQGEFTLTYRLVRSFLSAGIPCLAACTERDVTEKISADGTSTKTSAFRFVKFRRFEND